MFDGRNGDMSVRLTLDATPIDCLGMTRPFAMVTVSVNSVPNVHDVESVAGCDLLKNADLRRILNHMSQTREEHGRLNRAHYDPTYHTISSPNTGAGLNIGRCSSNPRV